MSNATSKMYGKANSSKPTHEKENTYEKTIDIRG